MVRTSKIRPPFFALVLLLLPSIAGAADNWIEVRSPHFTVCSNAGEKEARNIADQFEQIRGLFQRYFTTLRVNTGQPILILAAKNENTLKELLPEYWEVKGRVHLAGLYQPGQDKDYVVMRLNSEGDNPYHTLYHEYTHALLRLNFRNLPVWLNEGVAEFFGNSTLGDKESRTGTIDRGSLYVLNQNKLLPIEALLEVDHSSPYYNEQNRASVFYAESWALVHYLMMDPEAREKQLLKRFLSAFDKSGDQIGAARETFGDLKRFGQRIEGYARQSSFQISVVKTSAENASKNYPARNLSAGEVLALRGDFFAHHNRVEQAKPLLEEALKLEPNLAFAHEGLGYYHYRKQEIVEADKEMQEALRLGSTDFAVIYFHGVFLLHSSSEDSDSAKEAANSLEKAIQLNPQFAPAYESLANAYSRLPDRKVQAINAAVKAAQLDPSTLGYAVHVGYLLMNSNRDDDARTVAEKVLRAAKTPAEKWMANDLLKRVKEHAEWTAERKAGSQGISVPGDAPAVVVKPDATSPERETRAAETISTTVTRGTLGGIDGEISAADCSKTPAVTLTLDTSKGLMRFHALDITKVPVSSAEGATPSVTNCTLWKKRKVKVLFQVTQGNEFAGEIVTLHFY